MMGALFFHRQRIRIIACLIVASCSREGDSGPTPIKNKPKSPPKVESREITKPKTAAVFQILGSESLRPSRCSQQESLRQLDNLERFQLDGKADEWTDIIAIMPYSANLSLRMAIFENRRWVGVIDALGEQQALTLRLGQKKWGLAREYKIESDRFWERVNGTWQALNPSIAIVRRHGQTSEWEVDIRQIDQLRSQEHWWIQAQVDQQTHGTVVLTSTGASEASNFRCLHRQAFETTMTTETKWSTSTMQTLFDAYRFILQQIIKSGGPLPSPHLVMEVTTGDENKYLVENDILKLTITDTHRNELEQGIMNQIFPWLAEAVVQQYVESQTHLVSPYLEILWGHRMKSLMDQVAGKSLWRQWMNQRQFDVLQSRQPWEPLGNDSQTQKTLNQASILAEILGQEWTPDTWQAFSANMSILDEAPAAHGWLNTNAFEARFHPRRFIDQDGDGLPLMLEEEQASSDLNADSDKDGWSDATEAFQKTNPLARDLQHLMADGLFSDWAELYPSFIKKLPEANQSASCGIDTDIIAVASQRNDESLIASFLTRAAIQNQSLWELHLRTPSWSRLVQRVGQSYKGWVSDPLTPLAIQDILFFDRLEQRSIEFALDWNLLGIHPEAFRAETISIKLVSRWNDNLCDSSPWLAVE